MARTQNQQARPQQPEQQNRLMVGGVAALGLAAVAVLAILGGQSSFEPTPASDQAAYHAAPAALGAPQVSVVRIDAGGNAVIDGRAAPGSKVTIKTNGTTIGSTDADAGGGFTFVTSQPLGPGDQKITLSSRLPGGPERAPANGVAVNVPAMPNEGPLAVLTSKSLMASRLFGAKLGEPPKDGPLAIGSVDYSGTGSAVISGTAPPDREVELLLGNVTLGHTLSGPGGRWEMHVRTIPRLSGQFHLKALDAKTGAAPANTAYRRPAPSQGQPDLEA